MVRERPQPASLRRRDHAAGDWNRWDHHTAACCQRGGYRGAGLNLKIACRRACAAARVGAVSSVTPRRLLITQKTPCCARRLIDSFQSCGRVRPDPCASRTCQRRGELDHADWACCRAGRTGSRSLTWPAGRTRGTLALHSSRHPRAISVGPRGVSLGLRTSGLPWSCLHAVPLSLSSRRPGRAPPHRWSRTRRQGTSRSPTACGRSPSCIAPVSAMPSRVVVCSSAKATARRRSAGYSTGA